VTRRDEVIATAMAILRDSGPDALTSVNVATRMGMTQSAIYRHIRDMDELTAIAGQAIVEELSQVMLEALAEPEAEWGDGTHVNQFARRLVGLITEHGHGFAIVDRRRYDDGELGEGIRAILDVGCDLIANVLEEQGFEDFGLQAFDEGDRAVALAHARLIQDDVIAVARLVRASAAPATREASARLLSLRIFAGWCAYALAMTHRRGLPTPELNGPALTLPELHGS
jgi:AcrR family transcriptional regulator